MDTNPSTPEKDDMARDYRLAALAGALTGLCAIPTVWHLGVHNILALVALPPVIAVCWVAGIWLGKFLSRYLAFLAQFSKFVAVGFLNTSIDFGILNVISVVTGITSGFIIGGSNVPGFLLAALNSYVWNKLWVFRKIDSQGFFHDLPKFAAVTITGTILDSVIVVLFTTYLDPMFGMSSTLWLNIGKIIATVFVLFWNFTGFKYIVFRIKGAAANPVSAPVKP